jgi:hypothetical protein
MMSNMTPEEFVMILHKVISRDDYDLTEREEDDTSKD